MDSVTDRAEESVVKTTYSVENRQHVSEKTYEELVAEFENLTGEGEMGLVAQALSAAGTAQEWEESLEDLMGPSGFGRAFSMDHGRWLGFYGTPVKAKKYVYGNPVVAETILRYDTRAGLQVPLSILIYEDADGHGCVTYDLPSSTMGFTENPKLHQAAAALDAKLISFVEKLTGVPA
ncbi:DUF302 domain-containing protein [Streptomyces misionensis]|uniref:DUF302 domain-containing protein n=1 Tax=Streptomyces misionensis TaxID=67331 RepID=UPI00339FD5C4